MLNYVTLKCRCGLPARVHITTSYARDMTPAELGGGYAVGVTVKDATAGPDVTCYITCRRHICCVTAKTVSLPRPVFHGSPEHDAACEVARTNAAFGWNNYMAYFILLAELGPCASPSQVRECANTLRRRYAASPVVLMNAYRDNIIPAV